MCKNVARAGLLADHATPRFSPLLVLTHLLRQNNMSKQKLISDLQSFDLEQALCRTDFDRQFIQRAIVEWYGSFGPSSNSFVWDARRSSRDELGSTQQVLRDCTCVAGVGLVTS